jgi:hypothetical protein
MAYLRSDYEGGVHEPEALLLDFMGVKQGRSPLEEAPVLTDEFHFQLVNQSNGNKNPQSGGFLWEVFASIFPLREPVKVPWILAHRGRVIVSGSEQMSKVATFVALRFQTQHYFGVPLDYMAVDQHYPECPVTSCFSIILYETFWYQHRNYPKLPVPCLVTLLKEKGALAAQGDNTGLLKDM